MTPAPTLPPLSAVGTRDRLQGHLGHLTQEQEEALKVFKAKLEADEYYEPATATEDASHDDSTLLRFLRARKFDPEGAYVQFTSAEDWRTKNHVSALYDEFDVADFDYSQTVYPQWTGRRDRAGLPVYVFKVGSLTKEVINKYNNASNTKLDERMIALYEHMVQFVLPFCSSVPREHEETPISATTTIVDISHVSLGRFWSLRSHMQRASTLATANYAETLGTIYIVGAPNFFSVVWGWIGKWFDPGTVEKIFILSSHEVLPVLSRFIDPVNLPKAFGGELDWEYGGGRGPSLDIPAQETISLPGLPRGPIRWIKDQLVLKGSGRSVEEIEKYTPAKKEVSTPSEPSPLPAASTPTNGVGILYISVEEELSITQNSRVPDELLSDDEEDHDIWAAAREEPAAPVKELTAVLEGTTL